MLLDSGLQSRWMAFSKTLEDEALSNRDRHERFIAFVEDLKQRGFMSEREALLVILTAAFMLEDATVVREAIGNALQGGLTHAEVGEVNALVTAMRAGDAEAEAAPSKAPRPRCC